MNKVIRKNRDWQSSLKKKLVSLKSKEVAVGFPANKGLGTPYYEGGASVLQVAIYNNYGTHDAETGKVFIPARPFMDYASKDIQAWFKSIVTDDIKSCNSGRLKANEMFNRWGSVAKGMIQAQIGETPPPNAQSTIARKGSSTPLIDTGHMRQSVLYAIRDRTR